MSNRNDEGMVWVLPIALMAATAIVLFMIVYALAVLLSFAFTVFCFYAWNTPRRFLGEVVKPEEARLFVISGIAGMFILPILVLFLGALLQFQVRPDIWGHFYLGGYALGSLGTSWFVEATGIFKDHPAEVAPPVLIAGRETPQEPVPEPFRFARWDDEEPKP